MGRIKVICRKTSFFFSHIRLEGTQSENLWIENRPLPRLQVPSITMPINEAEFVFFRRLYFPALLIN